MQFGPLADFEPGVNELNVPSLVFLIIDGENISAFDRKDPNIGCVRFAVDEQMRAEFAIADRDVQFFDLCRGNAYDISGQPLCVAADGAGCPDFSEHRTSSAHGPVHSAASYPLRPAGGGGSVAWEPYVRHHRHRQSATHAGDPDR